MLGNLQVVFVVHPSNPIGSLDFTAIRKALSQEGKGGKMARGERRGAGGPLLRPT